MDELNKLEEYLKANGYEYNRKDSIKEEDGHDWHQIEVLKDGQYLWDVICHYGSYGYEEGLLEIMGKIVNDGYTIEGWLTADEIIKRLED